MSDARAPRVLVVDDEPRVRGVLCDLLGAWGCHVDDAAGTAQALALLAEGDYDVVLTDYTMPGGSGLELIEGVRHTDGTIGVILLTGSAADFDAPSRRLEFTVLRKPLQLDGLKTAVSRALRRRRRGNSATPY